MGMGANDNALRAEQAASLDDLRRKYLLMRCHKQAAAALRKMLRKTIAACEKTLHGLAAREENNSIKTLYLDARRELQIKHEALDGAFVHHLANEFYRDIKTEGWSSLNRALGIDEAPGQQLAGPDDLEEKIIIADLVSRASRRYSDLLQALAPQYRHLISEYEVKKDNQPLSPGRICAAFRQAVRVLDLSGPVMQVCYEQFERHILDSLGPLYIELGEHLGGADAPAADAALIAEAPAAPSQALREQQQTIRQAETREQQRRVGKIVEYEISRRVGGRQVPPEVQTLLDGVWKEMLAAIYLEEGFDSPRWEIALEITEDLLWSLQPKINVAERRRLAEMIPRLLAALRSNLEHLSWDHIRIESLFRELSSYHIANLRGPAANETPAREGAAPAPVREAERRCAEQAQAAEEIVLDGSPAPWSGNLDRGVASAADFAQARSMRIGDQAEFTNALGRVCRLKLEWKGAEREDFIFVELQTNASIIRSLEDLALDFHRGIMRRV